MHWQEYSDSKKQTVPKFSRMTADLNFRIQCFSLPVDHNWALKTALEAALPWLSEQPHAAIHSIHGAETGNGWIRPSDGILYLSRRTRLCLRLPRTHIDQARELVGQTLNVDGNRLVIGTESLHLLVPHKTLFCRHSRCEDEKEDDFIERTAQLLKEKNIMPPRMISGSRHSIRTPRGDIKTRSFMIDGLDADESLKLQEEGIGSQGQLGLGIFLPHKGIDAVYSATQKS